MLPEVLNNHFDYLIPDQINPLIVGEGNNENFTSDSEDSYHGFDTLDDNENTDVNVPNEPTNDVHALGANTLEHKNLNAYEKINVNIPTNSSTNVNAPGAGTLTKTVTFIDPKINKSFT
jgi:hypothetical protein